MAGRRARAPQGEAPAVLVWPKAADRVEASAWLEGVVMARRLVNTPAEDMGPAELAEAAKALAEQHGGRFEQVVGDAMLAEGFSGGPRGGPRGDTGTGATDSYAAVQGLRDRRRRWRWWAKAWCLTPVGWISSRVRPCAT